MKLFYKINFVGLILGVLLFLTCFITYNEVQITESLKLSKNAFGFTYIFLFVIISVAIPIAVSKWLNGSKWCWLLSMLWLPYLFIFLYLIPNFIPSWLKIADKNYGAAFEIVIILVAFPFYILLLDSIGMLLAKKNI